MKSRGEINKETVPSMKIIVSVAFYVTDGKAWRYGVANGQIATTKPYAAGEFIEFPEFAVEGGFDNPWAQVINLRHFRKRLPVPKTPISYPVAYCLWENSTEKILEAEASFAAIKQAFKKSKFNFTTKSADSTPTVWWSGMIDSLIPLPTMSHK